MKEIDQICVESQNILKKQFIEMNDLSTTEGNQYQTKPLGLYECVINEKKQLARSFLCPCFSKTDKANRNARKLFRTALRYNFYVTILDADQFFTQKRSPVQLILKIM